MGRGDLAGSAHLELVSGVAQLRPEDAMLAAMLRGWRAQQASRGLREDTMAPRDRLVRRFLDFSGSTRWTLRAIPSMLISRTCIGPGGSALEARFTRPADDPQLGTPDAVGSAAHHDGVGLVWFGPSSKQPGVASVRV